MDWFDQGERFAYRQCRADLWTHIRGRIERARLAAQLEAVHKLKPEDLATSQPEHRH